MKKLVFRLITLTIIFFTACGRKDITPVSVKIDGPLGSYFEVIDQSYQIDESGIVLIQLKRIQGGLPKPWVEGLVLGIDDNTYEPMFKAVFFDKEGNTFMRSETQVTTDEKYLNNLMNLQVGEIGQLPFKTDAKNAQRFKLESDFKVRVPFDLNLSGSLGKNNTIYMSLHLASNEDATGAYYYKRSGPKAILYLKGHKEGNSLSLMEYNKKGDHTGEFEGLLIKDSYSGEFESFKRERFNFDLQKDTTMSSIDFSQVDFDSFIKKEFYIANASSFDFTECEAFLDRYERVVNTYIAQKNKFQNGDKYAAKEMASALADYETMTEVAKNSLSLRGTNQVNRLAVIQRRMQNVLY